VVFIRSWDGLSKPTLSYYTVDLYATDSDEVPLWVNEANGSPLPSNASLNIDELVSFRPFIPRYQASMHCLGGSISSGEHSKDEKSRSRSLLGGSSPNCDQVRTDSTEGFFGVGGKWSGASRTRNYTSPQFYLKPFSMYHILFHPLSHCKTDSCTPYLLAQCGPITMAWSA
jgi:hypothetical protein